MTKASALKKSASVRIGVIFQEFFLGSYLSSCKKTASKNVSLVICGHSNIMFLFYLVIPLVNRDTVWVIFLPFRTWSKIKES